MSNASDEGRKDKPMLGGMFEAKRDPTQPTKFGKVYLPDAQWLAKAAPELVIEPGLAIIDTHHHLWDLPGFRYLLHDFLEDVASGHNIVATVFNECQCNVPGARPEGDEAGRRGRVLRRGRSNER